jgi:hypothetical protein
MTNANDSPEGTADLLWPSGLLSPFSFFSVLLSWATHNRPRDAGMDQYPTHIYSGSFSQNNLGPVVPVDNSASRGGSQITTLF